MPLLFTPIEPKTGEVLTTFNSTTRQIEPIPPKQVSHSYLEFRLAEAGLTSDLKLYTAKLYDSVNIEDLDDLQSKGLHLICSNGRTAYFGDVSTAQLVRQVVGKEADLERISSIFKESFSDAVNYGSLPISTAAASTVTPHARVLVIDDELVDEHGNYAPNWGDVPITTPDGMPVDLNLLNQAAQAMGDSRALINHNLHRTLNSQAIVNEAQPLLKKGQLAIASAVALKDASALPASNVELEALLLNLIPNQLPTSVDEAEAAGGFYNTKVEVKRRGDNTAIIQWHTETALPDDSPITYPAYQGKVLVEETPDGLRATVIGGTAQQQKTVNQIFNRLSQAINTPFQLRAGVPQWDGMMRGTCRSSELCQQLGVDAIIPRSAIKGDGKTVRPGIHDDITLFTAKKTEAASRQQKLGAQVLVNFPKGTQADILPKVEQQLKELAAIQADPRRVAQFYIESVERRQEFIQAADLESVQQAGEDGEFTQSDAGSDWLYETLKADAIPTQVVAGIQSQEWEMVLLPESWNQLQAIAQAGLPVEEFVEQANQVLEADESTFGESNLYTRFTVDDILNPTPLESDVTYPTSFTTDQRGGWNQLLEHPKVVQKLEEFMQQRWSDLAYGGIYVNAATAQPHQELKRGEVCIPDRPHGARIMVFRSPVANSADVRTFTNNVEGIRAADPEGFRQRGVGYMNPEDAADLKIDFDGDAPVFESDEEMVSKLTPQPLASLKSNEVCIPSLPNGQVVTLYHSRTQQNRFTNNTTAIPEDNKKRDIYLNPGTLEGMNADAPMTAGYYTKDGLHGFKALFNEVDELNLPENRPIQTVKRTKIPRDANHPKLTKFSPEERALAAPFERIEQAAIHAAHNPTGRVANVGMRLEALRHDLTHTLEDDVTAKLELYNLIQAKAKSILKTQAQLETNRILPILNLEALQPHLKSDPTAYDDLTLVVNQWVKSTEEVCVPSLVARLNQWFVEEEFMDATGNAPVRITPNDLRDWINVDALIARTKADLIPPPTKDGYDFHQKLVDLTANLNNSIKIGKLQTELGALPDEDKEDYLKDVAITFRKAQSYNASLIPAGTSYNFQRGIEDIIRIPTLVNASNPEKRIKQADAQISKVQAFLEQLAQLDPQTHGEFRKVFTNYRKQDDLVNYAPSSVADLDDALSNANQLIVQVKGLIDDELQKAVDTPKSARPIDEQILNLASDVARYKTIGWVKHKKDKEIFTSRWTEQDEGSPKTFEAIGVPDNDTRDPIGKLVEAANHHFEGNPLEQQFLKVYAQLLKADYTPDQQAIAQQVVQGYDTQIAVAIQLEEQAEIEEGPKLRVTSNNGNHIDVANLPLFDPKGASPVWDAVRNGEPITITVVDNKLCNQVFLPESNLAYQAKNHPYLVRATLVDGSYHDVGVLSLESQRNLAEIKGRERFKGSPNSPVAKQWQTITTLQKDLAKINPASNSDAQKKAAKIRTLINVQLDEIQLNGWTLRGLHPSIQPNLDKEVAKQIKQRCNQEIREWAASIEPEDQPAMATALFDCHGGQSVALRAFAPVIADQLQSYQLTNLQANGLKYESNEWGNQHWDAQTPYSIRVAVVPIPQSKPNTLKEAVVVQVQDDQGDWKTLAPLSTKESYLPPIGTEAIATIQEDYLCAQTSLGELSIKTCGHPGRGDDAAQVNIQFTQGDGTKTVYAWTTGDEPRCLGELAKKSIDLIKAEEQKRGKQNPIIDNDQYGIPATLVPNTVTLSLQPDHIKQPEQWIKRAHLQTDIPIPTPPVQAQVQEQEQSPEQAQEQPQEQKQEQLNPLQDGQEGHNGQSNGHNGQSGNGKSSAPFKPDGVIPISTAGSLEARTQPSVPTVNGGGSSQPEPRVSESSALHRQYQQQRQGIVDVLNVMGYPIDDKTIDTYIAVQIYKATPPNQLTQALRVLTASPAIQALQQQGNREEILGYMQSVMDTAKQQTSRQAAQSSTQIGQR